LIALPKSARRWQARSEHQGLSGIKGYVSRARRACAKQVPRRPVRTTISANLSTTALFEAAAAAWSLSPRRASRGKVTVSELCEPRQGRRLGIRIRNAMADVRSQSDITPAGAQNHWPCNCLPRLARHGLNDSARCAGFRALEVDKLALMGRTTHLYSILTVKTSCARNFKLRELAETGKGC